MLDEKLVMFGGWDMPIVFSDLHILDTSFVEWSQPKTKGVPPSPRRYYLLSFLKSNVVIVYDVCNQFLLIKTRTRAVLVI